MGGGDGPVGSIEDKKKDCNSVTPHLEMVFFEILTHTHTHCLVDQAWQC